MTTNSRFAGLDSRGRPKADAETPAPDTKPTTTPEPPAVEPEGDEQPKEPDTAPQPDAPVSPAPDTVELANVAATVFASDEIRGRERMAVDFMAHAPQSSADQVIAFLAKQPAPGAQAADTAAEDRQTGERMLAVMEGAPQKELGASSDGDTTVTASDRILAAQRKSNGRAAA